jgi:hypothetical protein
MFRLSHGARAAGDSDVDVVDVQMTLACVPVRGGGYLGDQPGRGNSPVGEPGRERGSGSRDEGDVQAGFLHYFADPGLGGGFVWFYVAACREPASEAGMPHQGGQPAALAVAAEDERAGCGLVDHAVSSAGCCAGSWPLWCWRPGGPASCLRVPSTVTSR